MCTPMTTTVTTKRPNARAKVLALLQDGQYHSTSEIVSVGGLDGARRLRELRAAGHQIVARKRGNLAEYRLYSSPIGG